MLAFGSVLAGAGMMLGNSVWESTLMRHVPDEWLSRLSAYDWFGSLAFQPIGLAMWGPIAVVIGISPALWVATAVTFVAHAAFFATPAIRNLTNEPQMS